MPQSPLRPLDYATEQKRGHWIVRLLQFQLSLPMVLMILAALLLPILVGAAYIAFVVGP